MTKEDAIKLLRACAILYYGADEEMIRLAENEFSGCAGTQRADQKELEKFLISETRGIRRTLSENKDNRCNIRKHLSEKEIDEVLKRSKDTIAMANDNSWIKKETK